MAQTVSEVLKQADLETDETVYIVLRLNANGILAAAGVLAQIGEPFLALIADRHEVTLVVPEEVVADFSERLRDHQISSERYRLITFDMVLEFDLIGFMAAVATALANAGISILPLAAYSRDHLLIPEKHYENALKTLQKLKAQS